jgi:hypothetical protein
LSIQRAQTNCLNAGRISLTGYYLPAQALPMEVRGALDLEKNRAIKSGYRSKHAKINGDFSFSGNQLDQMIGCCLTPAGGEIRGQHVGHGVGLIFQHLRPGINDCKILSGIMVQEIAPV